MASKEEKEYEIFIIVGMKGYGNKEHQERTLEVVRKELELQFGSAVTMVARAYTEAEVAKLDAIDHALRTERFVHDQQR